MKHTQLLGPYPDDKEEKIKKCCETCSHCIDRFCLISSPCDIDYSEWQPKTKDSPTDEINSPAWYTEYDKETIEIIKFVLGPEKFKAYCQGNELKYRLRFGLKDADITKDTGKAMKYKKYRDNI